MEIAAVHQTASVQHTASASVFKTQLCEQATQTLRQVCDQATQVCVQASDQEAMDIIREAEAGQSQGGRKGERLVEARK